MTLITARYFLLYLFRHVCLGALLLMVKYYFNIYGGFIFYNHDVFNITFLLLDILTCFGINYLKYIYFYVFKKYTNRKHQPELGRLG